ncbi:amidohydrolase family protein [Ideonella livida]|uniref:Amidohydrolase family protein n=1 Tax=Ideonella livida TaxID=2707176 RepID=A0A7C9PF30_9BURK|nr:amidohydrolase family protein [Ideonella livida]NDY90317.1 amidohydrolase family protein [Ideonella livida]
MLDESDVSDLSPLQAARLAFLASGDEALLPIVDAHHHFWDVGRNPHPWLQRLPRIPFRYGDYGAICRDYGPADHARHAGAHRVMRSVLMEGEWDPADPLGEARWVQALAAREGTPHALAAQAWLDREDWPEVLATLLTLPIVRSVRHKPRTVPRAEHHAAWQAPGSLRCPRWRAGYARLVGTGLLFELQAPWWHLDEAGELARDFPTVPLVLNHAGLPAERDAASLDAWRQATARLAQWPQVVVKLSGLGVPGQRWTPELQAPVVHHLLQVFGPSRCLVASNFPVDSLVATLDEILSGFKALTRHLPPPERLAVFCDNALRLYRLPV